MLRDHARRGPLGQSTDYKLIAKVTRCDAREGFRNVERVRDALLAYRCACGMLQNCRAYTNTIEKRFAILCDESDITGIALESTSEDGEE